MVRTKEDLKCLTDVQSGWCGLTESAGWSSVSAVSARPPQRTASTIELCVWQTVDSRQGHQSVTASQDIGAVAAIADILF